jgi:2-polyprenyl-3-methyl-5-hydroxy-6-metoxy-1,4-benzoquinol methylase
MIRTKPQPVCPVCNTNGITIHEGLSDFLSDVPGSWNIRSCTNKKCETIWLDPRPLPEDIHLLYTDYHTHNDPSPNKVSVRKGLKHLLDLMNESVLSEELNYKSDLPKWLRVSLNTFSKLHPGWRDEKKNRVLYVPFKENGSLLDVGCGAGNAMQILQDKGWKVTGTDFDEGAVENARKKGLDVHLGDLAEINFPSESFDTILCCNVIEHTHDPLGLIKECRRLLKKNGRLVMITNNSVSRGHKRFKEHWRGLEIPRHLQIFTSHSLEELSRQAGFINTKAKTCMQGIYYMWDASAEHEKNGTFELPTPTKWQKIKSRIKSYTSGLRLAFSPGSEESMVLYSVKD